MTLVDVLAGMTLLAVAMAILIPLSRSATVGSQRLRERIQVQAFLASTPIPTTPEGQQPLEDFPGCSLEWTRTQAPMAHGARGTLMGAVMVLRVVRNSPDAVVIAERRLPVWVDSP